MKTLQPALKDKKCIVCGNFVAWEGRLPCACSEHRYHEVFSAYDKARQAGVRSRKRKTNQGIYQNGSVKA